MVLKLLYILHPLVLIFLLKEIFAGEPECFSCRGSHTKRFPEGFPDDPKRQVIQIELFLFIMQKLDDIHESVLVVKSLQVFGLHLVVLYELLYNIGHEDALFSCLRVLILYYDLGHEVVKVILVGEFGVFELRDDVDRLFHVKQPVDQIISRFRVADEGMLALYYRLIRVLEVVSVDSCVHFFLDLVQTAAPVPSFSLALEQHVDLLHHSSLVSHAELI